MGCGGTTVYSVPRSPNFFALFATPIAPIVAPIFTQTSRNPKHSQDVVEMWQLWRRGHQGGKVPRLWKGGLNAIQISQTSVRGDNNIFKYPADSVPQCYSPTNSKLKPTPLASIFLNVFFTSGSFTLNGTHNLLESCGPNMIVAAEPLANWKLIRGSNTVLLCC